MDNKVTVYAFKGLVGLSIVVGIEGRKGESSIVLIEAGSGELQIRYYGDDENYRFDQGLLYYKESHLEDGERHVDCRAFKESEAPQLKRLSQFISTTKTEMDDDVLYEFLHALKTIKRYPRNSAKSEFVRHLQHHNINRERMVTPKAPQVEVGSQYSDWATW